MGNFVKAKPVPPAAKVLQSLGFGQANPKRVHPKLIAKTHKGGCGTSLSHNGRFSETIAAQLVSLWEQPQAANFQESTARMFGTDPHKNTLRNRRFLYRQASHPEELHVGVSSSGSGVSPLQAKRSLTAKLQASPARARPAASRTSTATNPGSSLECSRLVDSA